MARPFQIQERSVPPFELSTAPERLHRDVIHGYLTASYWAAGIPREVVDRSLEGSLNFAAYEAGAQVAFARVITDGATFGYLADVFVLESHRGRGISRLLMEEVMRHPDLAGVRRLLLITRDAHGLYAKFGFVPPARPQGWMERHRPEVYRTQRSSSTDFADATDVPVSVPP